MLMLHYVTGNFTNKNSFILDIFKMLILRLRK